MVLVVKAISDGYSTVGALHFPVYNHYNMSYQDLIEYLFSGCQEIPDQCPQKVEEDRYIPNIVPVSDCKYIACGSS